MILSLTFLNPSLAIVDRAFTFISCVWTTQYYGAGEFEIILSYEEELLTNIKNSMYVVKNDSNQIGVIERVRYAFTPNEGGTITVSGRMAISLLERRLIYGWNSSTNKPVILTICAQGGNVEQAARNTVNAHAITPRGGDTNRILTGLSLGTSHGYTQTAAKHVSTYQNLYSALTALLGRYNMGHRITYNAVSNRLDYEVYKGTDRSTSLVFSRQLENLLSFAYETDMQNFKTLAYMGGDGEGKDRFVVSTPVNGGGTRLNRREVFISASSNLEEGETASSYAQELIAEGKMVAAQEYAPVKSVEAEIDLVNSGLIYGEDYNVGDIILIQDVINYKPRITTIIESQSAEGYAIDVEFNEDAPEEESE